MSFRPNLYLPKVSHDPFSIMRKRETASSTKANVDTAYCQSFCQVLLAVCCLLFATFLLRRYTQIPHEKRINIRVLLNGFRGAARAMSRLRIDANQDRIVAGLSGLKRRCIFKRMRRHHAVVVIRSGYQSRRILCSRLDVMDRRVCPQHFELRFVLTGSIVSNPV